MRSKFAMAAATGFVLMLAAAPAGAQQPYYTGSGWGPIAAQAANAVTSGAVVTRPAYDGLGYAAYAYAPDPLTALASGLGAFAYAPDQVAAASWYSRGFGAYASAPAANLAVANYGLGMAAGAYCARRYKSYDASSGTFLGRDGQRHACP